MKNSAIAILLSAGCFVATTAHALSINVLEGADVTLQGEFFTGGWIGGDVPADAQARANSLVDGIFLPRSQQWNQGTVWWDATNSAASRNNYIMLDLDTSYYIESFVVQADDDDGYTLEYWDGSNWQLAMDIANYDPYGWGLQTRPNPGNDLTQTPLLPIPILTNRLRFSGDYFDSDGTFAVSEIQAYGYAAEVPEPSSLMLLGLGMLGFAATATSRRKQSQKLQSKI